MAAFAQFGSDLDKATQMQLSRGERLVEILKQGQYVPLTVEKQALVIYAATNGYVDNYPVEALGKYEEELYHFMDNRYADLMAALGEKKEITEEIKPRLDEALEAFKSEFVHE
jgi:F-type H+-transporting ATPase subunit alpha